MTADSVLDPARWQRVRALFDAALDQPDDRRAAWLAAQADDAALLREVGELLSHVTREGGAAWPAQADWPAPAGAGTPNADPAHPAVTQLGHWELLTLIGSGGMGDVYEARRADGQYEARVAVKLLRAGLDGAAVVRRFALEQQALARLQHPHIARLLDAGLGPDQRPYLVMELVRGRRIDQAVRGLPLDARLALFLQLTDAVAHAHKNLLVHRDIKPGNVLVDDDGQVKLLDFGIAKALDPLATGGDASVTVFEQRPFTPAYASPEQVRGEPVGTATDVYSLGVLLYQLLTGQRPTGRGDSTPAEAARSVLDETPNRASRLVTAAGQAASDDPHWPQTRRRLRGDLDRVLLKALEKPVDQRYASVDAFAADLRAWRAGYPVSVVAPRPAYVAARFIARHRLGAGLAAALLLSIGVGAGAALWQARQARQHLASIKSITRDAVFRFGDAVTYVPGGMAIKADLLQQMVDVLERLEAASGQDAELRGDTAIAYARLADIELNDTSAALRRNEAGVRHAARALELGRTVVEARLHDAEFVIWYVRAQESKARGQRTQGAPAAALATMTPVTPLLDDAIAAADPAQFVDRQALRVERARARHLRSQFLYKPDGRHVGRPADAIEELRLAREELVALEHEKHHAEILYLTGSVDGALALIRESLDELPQALAAASDALAERRAVVAELPQDVEYRDALVTEAMTLAKVELRLAHADAALAASTLSWDTNRQLEAEHGAGADNAWTQRAGVLALHHGRALLMAGHAAQAQPMFALALAHWDTVLQAAPADAIARRMRAWTQVQRVAVATALRQPAQARQAAERARADLDALPAGAVDARALNLLRAELAMRTAAI